MILTVTQTIADLKEERGFSGDYERYIHTRVSFIMKQQTRSSLASLGCLVTIIAIEWTLTIKTFSGF